MSRITSVTTCRRARGAARLTALALAVVLLGPVGDAATRNTQVESRNGMVASAHALASQAGVEILKAGGNAVDAAVAAAVAIGVAEPNATGIGGEGMMVIYLADRKTAIAIDYRSASPAKAQFTGAVPGTGHQAVAIPGTVAGLALALEKYGTMKLPQVMAPSIRIAREGFVVSPTLAGVIADNFEEIAKADALAKIFCPGGLPLEAGDTLKNPDLAATLEKIAAGGADVFYRGSVADAIAGEMKAQGGFITKDDLASYRAIERTPIEGTYRGYRLLSAPPPVGGLAVVEILQILEQFPMAKLKPFSREHVHVMAEAMRRGFADWSAYVGDPGFTDVPVAQLLSKPYASKRAAEIAMDRITAKVEAGTLDRLSPSTTSLSTVDKAGNMVALTQTLSDFFGSKVVVAGTGIILNNEMKNFSARGPNSRMPGKRMRTTIAPTIILRPDGRTFATIGTPGAARIISTMTLLVSDLVDYGMGIQEAIEAPRFMARDEAGQTGNAIDIEARLPADTQAALTRMGYTLRPLKDFDLFFGGAQGIIIDQKSGMRVGGADPRRDGAVVGYEP
jgi:gamma-glutamyltranspeptidase / glutathione hydrolase